VFLPEIAVGAEDAATQLDIDSRLDLFVDGLLIEYLEGAV